MIKILDHTASAPEDAWDVSQAQDGTVLAWVNEDRQLPRPTANALEVGACNCPVV